MVISMKKIFIALSLSLIIAPAQGASIQWDLYNVQFDDGGTAYGSFFYDADTNDFSNIDVTTTAGSTFTTDMHYELMNPSLTIDATGLHLTENGGTTEDIRAFNINIVAAMTNAGGAFYLHTPPAPTAFEGVCSDNTIYCNSFKPNPSRSVISGWVSTSAELNPVPIPAAVWLFGSGLLSLIGAARRKKSA